MLHQTNEIKYQLLGHYVEADMQISGLKTTAPIVLWEKP